MSRRSAKEILEIVRDKTYPLRAPLEALGIFGFLMITMIPMVLVLVNMDKLGIWWFPVLLAYFAVFLTLNARMLWRKHLDHVHFIMGDELFYKNYPKERERDRRKKERQAAYMEKLERRRREKEKN